MREGGRADWTDSHAAESVVPVLFRIASIQSGEGRSILDNFSWHHPVSLAYLK